MGCAIVVFSVKQKKQRQMLKRNNSKVSPIGTKGFRPEFKTLRREYAEALIAEWQEMPPQQQLDALDRRLGPGVGAVKQRARIAKLIK